MTQVLDHGYVRLVEHYGSDERIIEAARMSTGGGFKGWDLENPCSACNGVTPSCSRCSGLGIFRGDASLLRYLWDNRHETPFEMAGAVFEVKLPIFVTREWHRHRTQSYNEMSGRYIQLPNECYVPSMERLVISHRSKSNKQGSTDGIEESLALQLQETIRHCYDKARTRYEWMLSRDVAPEIARLVLPVNQYTVMRASANLRNWFGFLKLRMASNAQWEIQQYANAVADELAKLFPRSYALFKEANVQSS